MIDENTWKESNPHPLAFAAGAIEDICRTAIERTNPTN